MRRNINGTAYHNILLGHMRDAPEIDPGQTNLLVSE